MTTALYDYAFYNEKYLKNKSYIFYNGNNSENKDAIVKKFKDTFSVHEASNSEEVDRYISQYSITHIYIIKSGEIDFRLSTLAKNCIHCVFNCCFPHGYIYIHLSHLVYMEIMENIP